MSDTTDSRPTSPAAEKPLGELLFELRTGDAKLSPSSANTRLKQKLRERLFYQGEAMVLDWERGESVPEPLVLEIYLEVLKAPPEMLAQIEAALKAASKSVGPLVLNPQAQLRPVAIPEVGPALSLSWKRESVRLAAEQLRQRLMAQALAKRALQAGR